MKEMIAVLEDLEKYIPKLKNGIDKMCNNFKDNKINEGIELMGHIIEGLNWTIEAVVACESVLNVKEGTVEINNALEEVVEGMNNEDYDLIADVLQYEINSELNEWYNVISKELEKEQ